MTRCIFIPDDYRKSATLVGVPWHVAEPLYAGSDRTGDVGWYIPLHRDDATPVRR